MKKKAKLAENKHKEKKELKGFEDILFQWNSKIIRVTGRVESFCVFVLLLVMHAQGFDAVRILMVSVYFVICMIYQVFVEKYLKKSAKSAYTLSIIFWFLTTVFLAFCNSFLFNNIFSTIYGIVAVLLVVVLQFPINMSIVLGCFSVALYVSTSWFFKPHYFFSQDLLISLITLSSTVGGAILINLTKKEQVANLHSFYESSTVDMLTGVVSKIETIKEIEKSIPLNPSNALLVIDLDRFKSINDIHGHLIGDRVLHRFGEALNDVISDNGIVGRVGGDEFVVFFGGMNCHEAEVMADKLLAVIRKKFAIYHFPVTISIGIAQSQKDDTYNTLFSRADIALYSAKQNGRDGYFTFDSREGKEKKNLFIVHENRQQVQGIIDLYKDTFDIFYSDNLEETLQVVEQKENYIGLFFIEDALLTDDRQNIINKLKTDKKLALIPKILLIDKNSSTSVHFEDKGAQGMVELPFNKEKITNIVADILSEHVKLTT